MINISSDLDAIGKPQSGLLVGNVGWFGSYSECTKDMVDAHYCLAMVAVDAVTPVSGVKTFVDLPLRRLVRVLSCTRARKHTRQLNDSKLVHRKLNLA